MPAVRQTSNIWIILGVAATVFSTAFGFVWSVISGQNAELRNDLVKYQTDARWQFATKDYVNGKIEGIKEEETTYRKGLERILPKQ